jgi:serine/threonine protein phosphatase PrpC
MIGNGNRGPVDWKPINVSTGEGVLLCSDGLYEAISSTEMASFLSSLFTPGSLVIESDRLEKLCHSWVKRAEELGSGDDISVLLAYRQAHSPN